MQSISGEYSAAHALLRAAPRLLSAPSLFRKGTPPIAGKSAGAARRSACATVAALLLLTVACSKKEAAETEAPAPVQVAAVTEDTVHRTVTADGTLYPEQQWNVMPNLTAPVKQFLANRGDHVREGQLLAVLENRGLIATAAANKSQIDQAQANLVMTEQASVPESVVKAQTDVSSDQEQFDAAQRLYNSRKELLEQGALARKLVDDAAVALAQAKAQLETAKEHLRTLQAAAKPAQIEAAKAQVDAAKAQYNSAQAQVTYSEVHSPGTGIVADRPLYPGDIATQGVPLFVVMDISRVVARLNVPQAQATDVKMGQQATIQLVDTGEEFQGKVTAVSPATDPQSSTVQVWVTIPNPGEKLKPGASVHGGIIAETIKNALLVPVAAILPGEEGGNAVLVVIDGIAHKRPVQLGVRQGDKVQVLTGVAPREDVVTVGGMGVDDRAKVKVVEATAPEADDEDTGDDNAPDAQKKADTAAPKKK